MTEIEELHAEVARLYQGIANVMYTAELTATVNLVFSHALIEIMRKRMSRDEIIDELRSIELRGIGGRPDLEVMAHNIVGALIASIDKRSLIPAGHA